MRTDKRTLTSAQADNLRQSLILPEEIELADYAGTGVRSHVFRARLSGDAVVAKVYRDEIAQKYRRRYDVDIAEFEFGRNRALYEIDAIRAHVARPYRVYPESSEYSQSMIQEYVDGRTLKDVLFDLKHLPPEVLEAGYRVVRAAEAHGIHDLDISAKNVRVVERSGALVLTLCDFNLMPQHLAPPNPVLGFAIRIGVRRKSYRDYRNLRVWVRRGRKAQEAAQGGKSGTPA